MREDTGPGWPGSRQLRSALAGVRLLGRSEAGALAGDAAYLAGWQFATTASQLVQIALVTHVLGLHDYGRLALGAATVVLISQFFDVNVGVAATTFGVRALGSDPPAARSIFRLSYLTDALTGLAAFLVAVAVAPVLGPRLLGHQGGLLIVLYGLVCLTATLDSSSVSILRLLDRFKLFAISASLLELVRVVLVVLAVVIAPTLVTVVGALVVASLVGGCAQLWLAATAFRRAVQLRLFDRGVARVTADERRAFLRTVWHTNVISYVRLAQVQLPTLLVGALAGATQVGAYKLGTAAGCIPAKLLDPAQMAVLPRVSRLWAAGRLADIRQLLRRATYVSVTVTLLSFLLLVWPVGRPLLRVLGGSHAVSSAYSVLVVSALSFAVTAALFWNGAVLFAAGEAKALSRFYVLTGVAQCVLLVPLTAAFGALGAAAALLLSTVLGNLLSTVRAVKRLHEPNGTSAGPPLQRADEVVLSRG